VLRTGGENGGDAKLGINLGTVMLVLCMVVTVVGGSPPQARARALHMLEASPTAHAVIYGDHTEFVVRFDGPVDHVASRLEIVQSGQVIRALVPLVDSAVDVLFAYGETPPAGNYLLRWRAVSPDGEVSVGDLAFSVAP
jgi:methionine-rich copper-binding protein CopC